MSPTPPEPSAMAFNLGQRLARDMAHPPLEQPSEPKQGMAKFIAIVVRNALEDFRFKHLTDAQMNELYPILRSAICTALDAASQQDTSKTAEAWIKTQLLRGPEDWEAVDFLDEYRNAYRNAGKTSDNRE